MIFNQIQQDKLLQLLQQFLEHKTIDNHGSEIPYEEFWILREEGITAYQQLLTDFIDKHVSLLDLKERSEKLCRQFPYWGFKGMSGQMQLNQYVNNIKDDEKEEVLRGFIRIPQSIESASENITNLAGYLQNLKEHETNKKCIPRVNQSYFLSYFWEMAAPKKYPVYYGSSKKVLLEIGVGLDGFDDPGKEYLFYVEVMNELVDIISRQTGNVMYPYWLAEHVLWWYFTKEQKIEQNTDFSHEEKVKVVESISTGENLWLPSIITDLSILSRNKESEWSKSRKLKPEKAFETKLRHAFTLLGYDVTELGQGTGREPDGVARSVGVQSGDYAIIYDAKAREQYYSLGTEDRKVNEYITDYVEKMKKQRIYKHYFCIISSEFDERETMIGLLREIYKNTRVPISLLTAEDLLLIIETKLQKIDIDHKQLENLFLDTGLLTREKIMSELGL